MSASVLRQEINGILPPGIAVIGAGYWGKKVIREIIDIQKTTGRVHLHSVVDHSPTNLAQCQQEFGSLDYRIDYQELLNDPNLSGVHICTPNQTHFEIAANFLKHGKDVLVEKPLTLNSKDAFELVKTASKHNRVLCVGHIHRFNNGVRELRQAIVNGVLGELFYVRFSWTGFLPPQGYREVITDLSPHPFEICNYLLGSWPNHITCRGKGFRTKENEEVAFITAEHPNGVVAQIEISWLDREKRRDVTVVGSKGTAYLDCSEQTGVLHSTSSERILIEPSNTLRSEITHFVDCIQANSLSKPIHNLIPGIQGAHVVRSIEAARESLRERKTVTLTQLHSLTSMPKSTDRGIELLLEPRLEPASTSLWDRSLLDPDHSLADEIIQQSMVARIRSSRYRSGIIRSLKDSDLTPKELASGVGLDLSNLGKYLNDLLLNELVERKTPPGLRKGRLYGLTERGRGMATRMDWE
jgi:predicted dehydrogenase/DNA-binding HxlR family transcriptional regulator